MKTRTFVPYVLGLTVLSATSVSSLMASAQSAAADNNLPIQSQNQTQGPRQNQQRPPKLEGVKHTVTNIANGIVRTVTTENAPDVATIQSHTPPTPPAGSTVTVVKENLSNGIKVTITSTDATEVTRIQEREAKGPGMNGGKGDCDAAKLNQGGANTGNQQGFGGQAERGARRGMNNQRGQFGPRNEQNAQGAAQTNGQQPAAPLAQ